MSLWPGFENGDDLSKSTECFPHLTSEGIDKTLVDCVESYTS